MVVTCSGRHGCMRCKSSAGCRALPAVFCMEDFANNCAHKAFQLVAPTWRALRASLRTPFRPCRYCGLVCFPCFIILDQDSLVSMLAMKTSKMKNLHEGY